MHGMAYNNSSIVFLLLARPSQDYFLLPLIPWIELGGSILLVYITLRSVWWPHHLQLLFRWLATSIEYIWTRFHLLQYMRLWMTTTIKTFVSIKQFFSQFCEYIKLGQVDHFSVYVGVARKGFVILSKNYYSTKRSFAREHLRLFSGSLHLWFCLRGDE